MVVQPKFGMWASELMRLRLYNSVTYVPTPEGMLFRKADSFLPIRGQQVWEWFQRLKPFLDGRSDIDPVCDRLGEPRQKTVSQFLHALKAAEMVLEVTEDPQNASSEPVADGYVSRIEAFNPNRIGTFVTARQKPLLLLGSVDIVVEMIRAGLEAGLREQTFCVPEWNSECQMLVDDALENCNAKNLGLAVKRIGSTERWLDERRFESTAIALGLHCGNQDELLETVLGSRADSPRVLYLLATRDSVTVGAIESRESVDGLLELTKRLEDLTANISASRRTAGIAIGSRLLVQHLLDLHTEILTKEEQWMHYDLDLARLSVCKRPLLSPGRWPRLSSAGEDEDAEDWPFADHGLQDLHAKSFLERAERYLVDPKIGIILALEEGSLLQFPHHQSAARWRSPRNGRSPIWFTESGDDVYLARIGVIRRVMEHHFADRLTAVDPATRVLLYRSVECKPQTIESRYLPPGVVASALKRDELVPEAFFQAVARCAQCSDNWLNVDTSECEIAGAGELTRAYLDDICVLPDVRVQRHKRLSEHGCDVLRFGYGDRCVSVVAGPAGPGMWAAGLKDIWLDLTSRKTFAEKLGILPIRFRHSEVGTDLLEQAMKELRKDQRLQFGLVPLAWEEAGLVQPFFFSYAFVLEGSVSDPR